MENEEFFSLIPNSHSGIEIDKSIESISKPLSEYLEYCELPTENVLAPIEERRKILSALKQVIEIIPVSERKKSFYLTKFTISVTTGLFDGALNFLWDETIKALRKIVVSFDLQYFYSVSETISARYKKLKTEEDLPCVDDHDLLEICRRIGIINDIVHKRLDTVNYFRNHASAAHPNEHEISGIELLSYLEHCIKYAICGEFDHSVIQIKRLFANIRENTIPSEDFKIITDDLSQQPIERIEDFLQSIFGLYTDPTQEVFVRKNIEGISAALWTLVDNDVKYKIGSKYGVYRKNGDVTKKDLVDEFLRAVDGLTFKDEDSLAAELVIKLQKLKTAHYGKDNFYNEYPYAEDIKTSIPRSGIPNAAKKDFVKVISICYIGNGHGYRQGVDERALPYYNNFIKLFQDEEIKIFLHLFNDREFLLPLDRKMVETRTIELVKLLKNNTRNKFIIRALEIIENSRKIETTGITTNFKNALKEI